METVQGVTDLPLLLDTTNPVALEAGLQQCRQKAIINGFSLEPDRLEYILLACFRVRHFTMSWTLPQALGYYGLG